MKIIPAIDLIDGQNVRLSQGDYKKQSQMKKTPQQALKFYSGYQSVERIHVVDLMGALHKKAVESNLVSELAEQSALPLEIGGGIRSLETLKAYHDMGVEYFILGTRAIIDVPWLKEAADLFPGKIFVGVDAKENDIYINGWTENSDVTVDEYLADVEDIDLAGIIYTDIDKDGMGLGPNFENTARINKLTRHKVVASGGIRNKADLDELETLGIEEAIVGKASHTEEFWEGIK